MTVGTKSILFGAHQFLIHPWFVAAAWWRLYGFPWDPRLWFAFFTHDLGYWGKSNMDGPEGELHPIVPALWANRLFDRRTICPRCSALRTNQNSDDGVTRVVCWGRWARLILFHSRFLAKKAGEPFSRLCVADKLAIVLTPAWLYLPMARATGEIDEYMMHATSGGKYRTMNLSTQDQQAWYGDVQDYLDRWVEEHKHGAEDTWTPDQKTAITETGVWK